eukprot:3765328-Prymnesium_polylepis.1
MIESIEAVPFIAKALTPAAPCPPCTNRPHRTVPHRAAPCRTAPCRAVPCRAVPPPLPHGAYARAGVRTADFAIWSQRNNHYTTLARNARRPAKAHCMRSV